MGLEAEIPCRLIGVEAGRGRVQIQEALFGAVHFFHSLFGAEPNFIPAEDFRLSARAPALVAPRVLTAAFLPQTFAALDEEAFGCKFARIRRA